MMIVVIWYAENFGTLLIPFSHSWPKDLLQ